MKSTTAAKRAVRLFNYLSAMKKKKKDGRANNGGKRPGAKRPYRYGEPGSQLVLTVPASKKEAILEAFIKLAKEDFSIDIQPLKRKSKKSIK